MKQRQEALAVEQRDAQRLIELSTVDPDLAEQRLDGALNLLKGCDRLYVGATDNLRREFNQAFFEALFIDENGVQRADLKPPFAQLRDCTIGLDDGDGPDNGTPKPSTTKQNPSSKRKGVLT